jgi:hypothetical protein
MLNEFRVRINDDRIPARTMHDDAVDDEYVSAATSRASAELCVGWSGCRVVAESTPDTALDPEVQLPHCCCAGGVS